MRHQKRMNRYEKREQNREKAANAMYGEGIYVYRNVSSGDIESLPKPTLSGSRRVARGQEFQGDSYFLSLVGKGLRLVRVIVPAGSMTPRLEEEAVEPVNEEVLMENQKLILDQPDSVTVDGKVEHTVKAPHQATPVRKVVEDTRKNDVLLTEDPLSGVEILEG